MIVKHKVYGRVEVSRKSLDSHEVFIPAKLLNPRDNLPGTIMVGKAALDNCGNYAPPKRNNATRIEQYLGLAKNTVSKMQRPQDDWEELYAVATLGLVEADKNYDHLTDKRGFSSYAVNYVWGYIKNFQNPDRSGELGLYEDVTLHQNTLAEDATDPEVVNVVSALYQSASSMTKKQWKVMKDIYLYGYSEEATAKKLGITQQAVDHLKSKGIKHLRNFMGVAF